MDQTSRCTKAEEGGACATSCGNRQMRRLTTSRNIGKEVQVGLIREDIRGSHFVQLLHIGDARS